MDYSIKRRDRIEEETGEKYRELYEAEEEFQRFIWEERFGTGPRFEFKPDGASIHAEVIRQMEAMHEDY